jgi:hypothetical protein
MVTVAKVPSNVIVGSPSTLTLSFPLLTAAPPEKPEPAPRRPR